MRQGFVIVAGLMFFLFAGCHRESATPAPGVNSMASESRGHESKPADEIQLEYRITVPDHVKGTITIDTKSIDTERVVDYREEYRFWHRYGWEGCRVRFVYPQPRGLFTVRSGHPTYTVQWLSVERQRRGLCRMHRGDQITDRSIRRKSGPRGAQTAIGSGKSQGQSRVICRRLPTRHGGSASRRLVMQSAARGRMRGGSTPNAPRWGGVGHRNRWASLGLRHVLGRKLQSSPRLDQDSAFLILGSPTHFRPRLSRAVHSLRVRVRQR